MKITKPLIEWLTHKNFFAHLIEHLSKLFPFVSLLLGSHAIEWNLLMLLIAGIDGYHLRILLELNWHGCRFFYRFQVKSFLSDLELNVEQTCLISGITIWIVCSEWLFKVYRKYFINIHLSKQPFLAEFENLILIICLIDNLVKLEKFREFKN